MGANQAGSLNNKGFSSALSSGYLPQDDHITYAGSFNQIYFNVGEKAKQPMELYYGLSISNSPIKGDELKQKNYFIGLFNKSKYDGEKRQRSIHAVIVLDISGSMGGNLSRKNPTGMDRLALSKEAIKLFYNKLNGEDIFSLVTFQSTASTIIPSDYVKNFDKQTVFGLIDKIKFGGGTTLIYGFQEAQKNFDLIKTGKNYEKRIVMLTDVGDNSVANENLFIEKLEQSHIHTTIIGVSEDFRSSTCQKLKNIRGFNYFCATEDSDLNIHLYDHFDYTFFPCTFDIQITIKSEDIKTYDVYGSPDQQIVHTYTNLALKNNQNFIVTKMQSSFPSDFTKDKNGNYSTQGGLILVKFTHKNLQSNEFKGVLQLKYKTIDQEQIVQQYPLNYKFQKEEFHTCETMEKSIKAFYYTYCLKQTLKKMNSAEHRLSDLNRQKYLQNLKCIRQISASQKQKEQVDSFIKIVEVRQDI